MLSRSDFENTLKIRKILKFPCEEELKTPISHFFIYICCTASGDIVLSCCTSQFETVRKLIERNRFPNETLVHIPYGDVDNPFNRDTYVNCNEWFAYTVEELWTMYQNGELEVIELILPIHSFEQIVLGFKASPTIEEFVKEVLPDPNELQ